MGNSGDEKNLPSETYHLEPYHLKTLGKLFPILIHIKSIHYLNT